MGGFEKIMQDFLVDKRQAQRENMKVADIDPKLIQAMQEPPVDPLTGQPQIDPATGMPAEAQPQPAMPVNTWDNHQVHIQIHNQYRKTQQFELLDPAVKQEFELHVQLHQMAIQSQLIGAGGNVVEDNGAPPPGEEEAPQDFGSAAGESPQG